MDLRRGRNCKFIMHVHLVFITNYRQQVFTKEVLDYLKPVFEKVCEDFESTLVEFDGEYDHVHLLVHFPPKIAVSKLVNSLKGASSQRIRKMKFPSVEKALSCGSLWSRSYFAGSCGGAPIAMVRKYIESQQTKHLAEAEQ